MERNRWSRDISLCIITCDTREKDVPTANRNSVTCQDECPDFTTMSGAGTSVPALSQVVHDRKMFRLQLEILLLVRTNVLTSLLSVPALSQLEQKRKNVLTTFRNSAICQDECPDFTLMV